MRAKNINCSFVISKLSALLPDDILLGAWYDVEAVQINSALYGHYNYNTTIIVKNNKSSVVVVKN